MSRWKTFKAWQKVTFWVNKWPLDAISFVAKRTAFDLAVKSCHNRRLRT